ncbi:MAG: uracil-DNA glycosylase [Bacilli bacterium]
MITEKWDKILEEEYKKDYFINMLKTLQIEYRTKTIFPPKQDVFKALRLTDYDNIKIVILGQDPYHGTGEAEGLSFSVQDGIRKPPSLKNIFKELKDDLGYDEPESGSLIKWAKEGVLLLNSLLTVEKDQPLSHKKLGWETFTDEIIKKINEKDTPVVFILWGAYARSKKIYITNPNHFIIESTHPSPFSARNGFFGSKPFSKANNFLISKKISPVNFKLD